MFCRWKQLEDRMRTEEKKSREQKELNAPIHSITFTSLETLKDESQLTEAAERRTSVMIMTLFYWFSTSKRKCDSIFLGFIHSFLSG